MDRPAAALALSVLFALFVFTALAGGGGAVVPAEVLSVYDGDTLTVRAYPWPGVATTATVRIRGIDAPEMRGGCLREKRLAIQARDFVRSRVLDRPVTLTGIEPERDAFGRVLARVETADGDLGTALLARGLATVWPPPEDHDWCARLTE